MGRGHTTGRHIHLTKINKATLNKIQFWWISSCVNKTNLEIGGLTKRKTTVNNAMKTVCLE